MMIDCTLTLQILELGPRTVSLCLNYREENMVIRREVGEGMSYVGNGE